MYALEVYEPAVAIPDSLNVHRHPVVSASKEIVTNRERKRIVHGSLLISSEPYHPGKRACIRGFAGLLVELLGHSAEPPSGSSQVTHTAIAARSCETRRNTMRQSLFLTGIAMRPQQLSPVFAARWKRIGHPGIP